MQARPPFACAFFAAALMALEARAIPLRNDFGGPLGYGEHSLPAGDSAWSEPISIAEAFPSGIFWFGPRVRALWVNTNGVVSLSAPFSATQADTPTAFPVLDRPLIAAFWSDVDTRGGGQPARNSIWWTARPDVIAITWHDVERHIDDGLPRDGRSNDFQMILERVRWCAHMDWRLEYRFHRIEWTAPDRAPPSPDAQVGFDGGNQRDFVSLPMSRTPAIADVARTTNVPDGEPGLYRFSSFYSFDGAVCSGYGTRCEVPGALGICAQSVTECRGYTDSYCRPVIPRRPRCNGRDNDCDGRLDDDDSLCPPGTHCDPQHGTCAPACTADRDCAPEARCTEGRCIANSCQNVQCPPGEFCREGVCMGLCDTVRCPYGQRCSQGACIGWCEGAQCAIGQCIAGECSFGCGCFPCPDGGVCGDEGFCIEASCAGVRCASRTHCEAGRCVSDCARPLNPGERVCPWGEVCEGGVCVLDLAAPNAWAPLDAGAPRDATPPPTDAPRDARTERALTQPGCSCHTGASRHSGAWAFALLLYRRRRRFHQKG